MRKIKSVKLLKDLPGVPSGTIGRFKEKTEINDIYEFLRTIDFGINFMKDFPTWFEIEYEEERKYIDVRIEFENKDYCDAWKPAMIRDIENTLNNNFKMTKNFKVTELERESKEYEEIIDERKNL